MKLPKSIREQFRRYGAMGGHASAGNHTLSTERAREMGLASAAKRKLQAKKKAP